MMPQYRPEVKTLEDVEDLVSLPMIYEILEVAAGVKMAKSSTEEPVSKKAENSESSWDTFDLAKLESEAFLLGIWKDFEELETCLSMPELTAVLSAKREDSYEEKKFLAAIQGVDIEKNKNDSNAWEEMKARVFSGGKAENGSDILAFQGANAAKAGFGIGLGLAYEDLG
jgi:tyrosyl-tRNA synthetase